MLHESPRRRTARGLLASALLIALACAAACSKDPQKAKQAYFESGERYFAAGRLGEASVEYRNAIQQDPRFGEARFKLAEVYAAQADAVNAYREYIRAADLLPGKLDAQLKAGTVLLLAGQYEDAKTRAARALVLDPKNLEALLLHANATAGLKDVSGAIREIVEAIALDPTRATAHANLGALELLRGNQAEAEAAYVKAVALDPKNVGAQLAYANFLLSSGRSAEAEAAIKLALASEPKHLMANRALATLYVSTGRPDAAEPYMKTVAQESPSGESRLQLADYYVAMRRGDEALGILQTLAGDRAFQAQAKTRIAAIQFAKGQRKEAAQTVDDLLAALPTNPLALMAKARLQQADGKIPEALASAVAATKSDPQSAPAYYLLGSLQAARGDGEEATKSFREVLKLNPRAVSAQVRLSQIELSRGSAESSVQLAQAAIDTEPGNPVARLMLARGLTLRGQLDRAEQEVQPLLKRYPQVAVVHAQSGAIALARGQTDVARRAFEQALALDGNSLEALSGLISLDLKGRNPAAAVKRMDEALARTPTAANLYLLAARTRIANRDAAGAEQALRKAIELDSSLMGAYGMLGQLYLTQQKPDQAVAEFERIVAQQPNNVAAHTLIALLFQMTGKNAEAQQRYEKILAIDSRAAVAANNLAWMYAENDVNLDQALQLAQTAQAALPDTPEVNDTLGYVYIKKNLATLAVGPLRLSVEQDPTNPLYLYRLGLAYSKTGDKVAARKALEGALKLNQTFPGADEARQLLASLQG